MIGTQPFTLFSFLLALGISVWMLVAILEVVAGIPFEVLAIDPNTLAGQPFFYGAVSNVGVLIWAATAAIAIWTALHGRTPDGRLRHPILLHGGLLTAVLAADDLFMLHESAGPLVGIPETVVFAVYGLLILGFLARYVFAILASPWLLLLAALGCFAGSIALDVLPWAWIVPRRAFLEDAMKFMGLLFWAGYFVELSGSAMAGLSSRTRPG